MVRAMILTQEEYININTTTNRVHKLKKSSWKRFCKQGRVDKISRRLRNEVEQSTKQRFLIKETFIRKDYIKQGSRFTISEMMKIRLNMTEQKINYKGSHTHDLSCPLSQKEPDTTEHVL